MNRAFDFILSLCILKKKICHQISKWLGAYLSKWVFIFDPLFATPEELRRLKSSLELSIAHSICSNELTVKRWSRLMKEHYYWGAKKDQIVFFFHSSWIKRLMFDAMKQVQNLPWFWNMKTPWFFFTFFILYNSKNMEKFWSISPDNFL